MGIAQWRDSCGDRPHTLITVSFVRKYDLATRWKRTSAIGNEGEKKSSTTIAYSRTPCPKVTGTSRKTQMWNMLRGLRACAERASKPRTTNLDLISKTTKELLERRRALRFDPNASHIERLVANTSCRKALREDLMKYRQKKILEAAQRRTSLKKCRRDLREYNIPLAALLSEDGTRTSSCCEMEIITERFYSRLFRSSTQAQSSPLAKLHHGFSFRKYESLSRA